MINEDKVKLMTKAALMKKRNAQKNFAARSFFGTDYVSFQMLKAFVGVTAAFAFAAALYVLARFDELTTAYSFEQLLSFGKILLVLYAAVLLVAVLLSLLVYTTRYWEAKDDLREYQRILKQIGRFYSGKKSASGGEPGSRGKTNDGDL